MNPLRTLLLPALVLASSVHAADEPAYLGEAKCRIAQLKPAPKQDWVVWSGGCKDGYAEGKGTLKWRTGESEARSIEATLVRGEIAGEGTLTYEAGTYIGTFRNGLPHGSGYFKHTGGGGLYEGGVVDGLREGAGVHIAPDRSTYEGEWKAGKRHGIGKAVFALGGSYEGEWRNGKFNGKGKITYAGSGRVYEGEFLDGRPANAALLPAQPDEHKEFMLKGDERMRGSRLKLDIASSVLPHDASWKDLTPAQQAIVRSNYPALDAADEPPYPIKGSRPFTTAAADIVRKFPDFVGIARVHLLVGADGVPKLATAIGMTDPEVVRYLSLLSMIQRFKPAMCAGAACEMSYPIEICVE